MEATRKHPSLFNWFPDRDRLTLFDHSNPAPDFCNIPITWLELV